jgi:hypothetical protein
MVILKHVNKSLHLLRISNSVTPARLDMGRQDLTPNNIAAKYRYAATSPLGDLLSARR